MGRETCPNTALVIMHKKQAILTYNKADFRKTEKRT